MDTGDFLDHTADEVLMTHEAQSFFHGPVEGSQMYVATFIGTLRPEAPSGKPGSPELIVFVDASSDLEEGLEAVTRRTEALAKLVTLSGAFTLEVDDSWLEVPADDDALFETRVVRGSAEQITGFKRSNPTLISPIPATMRTASRRFDSSRVTADTGLLGKKVNDASTGGFL